MAKKLPKSEVGQLGDLVATRAGEQLTTLLQRNWGEVNRIMGKDGDEIKVSASITIRNRSATPGEQADKDNGLRVSIAYAEKHSDTVEMALPDPNQPDLPGTTSESESEE